MTHDCLLSPKERHPRGGRALSVSERVLQPWGKSVMLGVRQLSKVERLQSTRQWEVAVRSFVPAILFIIKK